MMDGSGTTDSKAAAAGLAEVGAMLRRRREELGQDLRTIATATHIRHNYLKAIEEGRRRDLPGTTYMIGYVRTYADYLGFDGNRLVTDYHAQLAGQRRKPEKEPEPEPDVRAVSQMQVSPTIIAGAVLLLAIGGYIAWGAFTKEDPVGDIAAVESTASEGDGTEVTPEPSAEPADNTAPPIADAGGEGAVNPEVGSAEASTGGATRDSAAGDTAVANPDATTGDQVPPEADVASTSDDEVTEESPPQPEATEGDVGGKIVVRARLESWIQVTNAKKEVVFSRVLRVGETYTVPEEKGLMLTTGNAGGVDILVNGKKLKSLGAVGLVRRDLPLDAKKLRDGTAFKPAASNAQ